MAVNQMHIVEDPEVIFLPGYYNVLNCEVRVLSMIKFGLMNVNVLYITTPRPAVAYEVIAEFFKTKQSPTRFLTEVEENEIIDDLKKLVSLFSLTEQEGAAKLLRSAFKPRKTDNAVPGGITRTGEHDDYGESEPFSQDQLDIDS